MPSDSTDPSLVSRMARFVSVHLGLNFPSERESDLLRGLDSAARDAGFDSTAAYAEWLLSRPPRPQDLQRLAPHITIGETYFFREQQALSALSHHILPTLIAERRGKTQSLRLWSAACSTGEEAYSLAIMLRELLPDWDEWQITLLATDINPRSLEKAAAGIYGEWSFRTLPNELRARYFTPTANRGFAISDSIKRRVTFAEANLAADTPPSVANMDVILCRNLLIYFTAEQSRKLVANLHAALIPGGSLVVSPSELSQHVFSHFLPLNFPGAVLYRKPLPGERPAEVLRAPLRTLSPTRTPPRPAPPAAAPGPRALDKPQPVPIKEPAASSTGESHAVQARSLANLGRLAEALISCELWVKASKVDPAAHYLHATVLQELGDPENAQLALNRCIYLQPDFALAHFALGNLERGSGRQAESQRHYRNAWRLLETQPPDALLPEAEGLTVGRVAAIVSSLLDPDDSAITAGRTAHAHR